MSLSATVIDSLVASGVTVEQLAAAIKADLAEGDTRAQAKRDKDAARQRKSRKSRSVTVTPRDSTDSPPKEYISNPPSSSDPNGSPEDTPQPLKPEHVVEAWNDMAERLGLPTIRKLSSTRLRQLRARMRDHGIDDFTEAISAIERSPFLRGEGRNGWRADFDFLLQPSSFLKLIEGSYDRAH